MAAAALVVFSTSGTIATAAEISDGTVKIGLHISANLQAAYAAFGAKNAGGDITPQLMAVVDWINAHGGMHGRKVEPIFHASDPLNGSFDAEAQDEEADQADGDGGEGAAKDGADREDDAGGKQGVGDRDGAFEVKRVGVEAAAQLVEGLLAQLRQRGPLRRVLIVPEGEGAEPVDSCRW